MSSLDGSLARLKCRADGGDPPFTVLDAVHVDGELTRLRALTGDRVGLLRECRDLINAQLFSVHAADLVRRIDAELTQERGVAERSAVQAVSGATWADWSRSQVPPPCLVAEPTDDSDGYAELWIGDGDDESVSVHLTPAQCREVAESLTARADLIDAATDDAREGR